MRRTLLTSRVWTSSLVFFALSPMAKGLPISFITCYSRDYSFFFFLFIIGKNNCSNHIFFPLYIFLSFNFLNHVLLTWYTAHLMGSL